MDSPLKFGNIDFGPAWDGRILLLKGAGVTLYLTTVAMCFGLMIGLLMALARISKYKFLQYPARVYISFVRGTPLLVQLYIVYFALPDLGIVLPATVSGLLALSINIGAYLAEVFRAGIQSVPRGQYEASLSVGMNFFQTYWRTIIPQAVRNVLPAIGNDYIGLMKDTSLVSVVTITELLRQGNIIARSSFSYLGPYIAVALMYWAMTFVSATILERIEKRLEGGRT